MQNHRPGLNVMRRSFCSRTGATCSMEEIRASPLPLVMRQMPVIRTGTRSGPGSHLPCPVYALFCRTNQRRTMAAAAPRRGVKRVRSVGLTQRLRWHSRTVMPVPACVNGPTALKSDSPRGGGMNGATRCAAGRERPPFLVTCLMVGMAALEVYHGND